MKNGILTFLKILLAGNVKKALGRQCDKKKDYVMRWEWKVYLSRCEK